MLWAGLRWAHRYRGGVRTRRLGFLAAAVVWTLFVWINRIRNALADESLGGSALAGVLVLSASFVVGALAIGAMAWRSRSRGPSTLMARSVMVMAGWNTVVWASRIVDIAMDGGHGLAFVAVHAVIGLLSIFLWLITAFFVFETGSEEISLMS